MNAFICAYIINEGKYKQRYTYVHTYTYISVYFFIVYLEQFIVCLLFPTHNMLMSASLSQSIYSFMPRVFNFTDDNLHQESANIFQKVNISVATHGLCQNYSTLSLQQESSHRHKYKGVAVFIVAQSTKQDGIGLQAVVC